MLFQTRARVNDHANNTVGSTKNSLVHIAYNSGNSKSDNSQNVDIVAPNINITKTYLPAFGDGGDSIQTVILIENT